MLGGAGDLSWQWTYRVPADRPYGAYDVEVTAWDDRLSVEQTHQWGHTHVDEMIDHVDRFEGRALVLARGGGRTGA